MTGGSHTAAPRRSRRHRPIAPTLEVRLAIILAISLERSSVAPVADLRRQLRGIWLDIRQDARLRDEAPGAYKDIGKVMRPQWELTRIVRTLRPILSYECADG